MVVSIDTQQQIVLNYIMHSKSNYLYNLNKKSKEVFVLGDININFLNYNRDNKISDYLDMLLDLGYMPLITKAMRITDYTATLIDHKRTTKNNKSGNMFS